MNIMRPFAKTYELPLAKTYVQHWGMVEAVRELIQNALDSDSPFEYDFGHDSLIIRSRYATLSPSTLLLGSTSKAENKDKIGSFGEGYKIAMLVLTREGYGVTIHNGDRNWTPCFRMSRQFGAEVLCIDDVPATSKSEGMAFEVSGLTPGEKDSIVASCLRMQKDVGAVSSTIYGRILHDMPGKLFVGGLFVCDTDLQHGYDIKPEHLQLERDRQTVSGFDLQWLVKQMWFQTERYDDIACMIESGCPDLAYAHHCTPELVKDACYKLFKEKNPDAVSAKTQEELNALVARGMTRVVVHHVPVFSEIVSGHSQNRALSVVVVPSPAEVMREFFEKHRKHMRTPAIVEFKQLIKNAENWKN